ncbi:MAG: cation:proton antiporter [Firmicutes bacterium]|nr:cation:proton antiporter [Bacillota bacterium]
MLTVYSQPLGIAIVLLLGLAGGRLARIIKMPMVVGYLIMGVLLSPSILHIIPNQLNNELEVVRVLGLGMIALMIGSELEIKKMKDVARAVFTITIVQIAGAFVFVFLAMYYLVKLPLPISLLLGALATATAPAATVAVIKEYKAKGPLTRTLLGVVALDDAACIILFGIVIAIVAMIFSGEAITFQTMLEPFKEVFFSGLLGVITGLLLVFSLRLSQNRQQSLVILLAFTLLNSGAAYLFDLSPLLVNMVTGFVAVNIYEDSAVFQYLEDVELPIFIMFFTLTGATLHLEALWNNWVPAAVSLVARGVGKVGGAFLGARLSGAEKTVQKYLGYAMFSKAGVTVGLLMIIQQRFPEIAVAMTAIVLAEITVCELIGPMGTRYALIASGEARQQK